MKIQLARMRSAPARIFAAWPQHHDSWQRLSQLHSRSVVSLAPLTVNRLRLLSTGLLFSRATQTMAGSNAASVTYLTQEASQSFDKELMGDDYAFTLQQLMELAGLSVAAAVEKCYSSDKFRRILVICGPGNNGGDGLVAARHLQLFGYDVSVLYPKRSGREPFYANLVRQCEKLDIPFVELDEFPAGAAGAATLSDAYDVVVDAIFGFSFSGELRAPFDRIVTVLSSCGLPIVSVDVPSGWDIERGDVSTHGLEPELLVSLSAPKSCAAYFRGRHHYVGGRFVPPALAAKYSLQLPPYSGADQIVEVPINDKK